MTSHLIPRVLHSKDLFITFSTKEDGNMLRTNETRVAVHKNRMDFLRKSGIRSKDLFLIRTSHSPNIDVVERSEDGYTRRTYLRTPTIETDFDHYYTGSDGAITLGGSLFIGLMSGDCVPLLLWDNHSGMYGILHIGLLGALNGMVRGLPHIFAATGVRVKDTEYYVGPSITQRNYNISKSGLWKAIEPQIRSKIPEIGRFISRTTDGEYLDLQGIIISQLSESGIEIEQIQRYEHCIADDESIFLSHNVLKKDGIRGNFLSIIGRKVGSE